MAPLPENSTMRIWIKQEGPRGAHETMFRFADGVTVVDAIASIADVLTAGTGLVYDSQTWTSARHSAAGSDISFPVAWTPIPGTNGSAESDVNKPFFLTWVGRSTGGRRVTWTIGGAAYVGDTNFRIVEGENPGVDAVIDALRVMEPPAVAIDGLDPLIYPYANCGFNAYFQRKQRRTG